MISVQIRYFASLRELKGCDQELVELDAETTACDLGRRLNLSVDGKNCMVAVNKAMADPGQVITDGDEVAFFPPVTGG